jgi:hypothetical protein
VFPRSNEQTLRRSVLGSARPARSSALRSLVVVLGCKNTGVSGWGNQSGIAYQQAHAVLACFEMLDGGNEEIALIGVESGQDVFDLELCDSDGNLVASRQIKNRALDRTWTPSDIYPLIRRWATSDHPERARFELRLGGRLGPAGETLTQAIRAASRGDRTPLVNVADGQLTEAEIEAATSVYVTVDPTPTSSLLTAGTQQALAFLPDARTGADALDEADAILGRLYRLVMNRAGSRSADERIVTRTEVLDLFGLDQEYVLARWDQAAVANYLDEVLSRTTDPTVDVDLRRQQTPVERATGQSEEEIPELSVLLELDAHALMAGQSGSGKSTAARTLREMAARTGRPTVIVNSEAYIPGRLAYLICNSLSLVTGKPVPLPVGRGVLNDRSAVVIFDGASEVTSSRRDELASELAPFADAALSCTLVLIGRDLAILNSILPHYVPKNAYLLRGIKADQREELVAEFLRPMGETDTAVIRSVSAKAGYALKAAANIPYLLRMGAELVWRGLSVRGRANMYTVFTHDMARQKGLIDVQFCLLALGIAYGRLLDLGRRECDQFDWRQLLEEAVGTLASFGSEMSAEAVVRTALQGGFVAYEEYDQTVRPVHDSLADYFAALAHAKGIYALPATVTENDALRLRFLAELSGVQIPLGTLVTRCVPLSAVEISMFDDGPLTADSPEQIARYLENLLAGTTLGKHTVQLGTTADGRVFGFLDARANSEIIPTEQIYDAGLDHGMVEVSGGTLKVAVALWKSLLKSFLGDRGPGGRIPTTAESAVEAVVRHHAETQQAISEIVAAGFPEPCRSALVSLAAPKPVAMAIRPTMNSVEPYWPMLSRPSSVVQIEVGDFDEWSKSGIHTGWGSVDSVLRMSPTDTAKKYVRQATDELVNVPWLG